MKKVAALVAAVAVCVAGAALAGCNEETSGEINITGSSSVSPLMGYLADAYEAKNTNITINISTSDSGSGVKDAQSGSNDFGMASRAVRDTETGVTSKTICNDGVAIIVNTASTLSNITGEEVYNLYANGTAVGSVVGAISREAGSGTRDAFDGLIKNAKGDKLSSLTSFASCVDIQNSTGNVKVQVTSNASLLGYISMGSLDSTVKALSFEGVAATIENVKNGSYALSRPFNIVYNTANGLSKDAQAFIDFIMSAEGKAIITEHGFIAL